MPAARSSLRLVVDLALPASYRFGDVLAFYGRDKEHVAERVYAKVDPNGLSLIAQLDSVDKALLWFGHPACLNISFLGNAARISLNIDIAEVKVDAAQRKAWTRRLGYLSSRVLGLDQDILGFEQYVAGHHEFARLVGRNSGLRVPQSINPFEALCWAITGQQISVSAAVAVRRRFITLLGLKHSSGLLCHPDPARVAACDVSALRSVGLSDSKAKALLTLALAIQNQSLVLADLDSGIKLTPDSAEVISNDLLGLRGIGPWTVNYALLRGFGYLNGSLHGDVAARRNLQSLLGRQQKLSGDETEQWLAQFTPWRALAAAHLWAMQSAEGF
ncbi:DNA-3-methyladenine glycosylase 2 [Zhongshania aquimaris]|uniref:DNA-3-methyladenine glycosylase II n=1 Tax=Zhongshania aquimaris TaxID=2857107 RepID=A0ABS6VVW4_9GAMM|nr:hypothetical protein [Zhongshania aquimaris]MBW2941771.1 hypothetical protein [Zhongshania aquimaris]